MAENNLHVSFVGRPTTVASVAGNLAELIVAMSRDGRRLATIIEAANGRYVQFLVEGTWLFAEVSSNTYLTGDARLDSRVEARLLACGWNAPDEGKPNWWIEAQVAELPRVITAAGRSMVGALGLAPSSSVRVRTFPVPQPRAA